MVDDLDIRELDKFLVLGQRTLDHELDLSGVSLELVTQL